MKFIISDQLDLRYEAISLLERIASHSGDASGMYSRLEDYCAHYFSEYDLPDTAKAQLEALQSAGRHAEESLTIPQEDLAQYFVPLPEAEMSLAGIILFMHTMFGEVRPDDNTLIRAILTMLEADSEEQLSSAKPLHDLTARISASSLPAEVKWAAIDVFLNYDQRRDYALRMIDEVTAVLERDAAPLQAAAAACADILHTFEASGGLDTMFRDKGLTLDTVQCEIIPCAMRFSAISLFGGDFTPDGQERMLIRYGMLFDLLESYAKEQRSASDELLRFAKALADKTRMQILFALRDAPLYAQDVVSLTGLSAATVSHHMSELASVGFVGFEKQGTRILYRLLPKKVERLAELLKTLVP